jgi:hypothetical protein
MKENYTQLYPNKQVTEKVSEYALTHSTRLPQYITEHHSWGSELPMANYMISPLQAQFQLWTARAVGAKRSMSAFSFSPVFYLTKDHITWQNALYFINVTLN